MVAAVGVAATLAASAGSAQAPVDESEGIIFERQLIMLQLEEDSETLGMIAAGLVPREQLPGTTRSIAKSAKNAIAVFEAVVPGGRSKPEVWSSREDFMKRMKDFAQKTDEMAKVGEKGDLNAVSEMMVDALPCKGCHNVYREKKK